MTGYDGMKHFRDKYNSPREAVKVMQAIDGLYNEICRQIGPPVSSQHARRGDLVQLSNNGAGICLGNRAIVTRKNVGVTYLGREMWRHCWYIG